MTYVIEREEYGTKLYYLDDGGANDPARCWTTDPAKATSYKGHAGERPCMLLRAEGFVCSLVPLPSAKR